MHKHEFQELKLWHISRKASVGLDVAKLR